MLGERVHSLPVRHRHVVVVVITALASDENDRDASRHVLEHVVGNTPFQQGEAVDPSRDIGHDLPAFAPRPTPTMSVKPSRQACSSLPLRTSSK